MSEIADPGYVLGDIEDEAGNPESDLLAEHQLIGALLWHPEWSREVRDLVSSGDFFDRALGRMFKELVALDGFAPDNDQVLSWLGVADIAGRTGKQALGYLRALAADIDADRASVLADRIFELAERRLTAQGQAELVDPTFQSQMGLLMWGDRNSHIPDEYDYLVEDTIPEKELTIIMGATQAGKSFLAFHLAMCMTRAVPFFGRNILAPVPVVWCAYEGGRGARGRMLAYARHHDVQAELLFAALTSPIDLWSRDLNVDELIKEIRGIVRSQFAGKKPGAIFIDTHNAATPGASEIDSEAVSKIRDRYKALIAALGCAVIIIGHTNALGKHRGNELLVNNVDTVITVTKKTVLKNRIAVQLRDDDNREVRSVDLWKQREGETGRLFDFVLPAVETGIRNKFGKSRTSCVVVKPNWSEQAEAEANSPNGTPQQTMAGIKLTDKEDYFFKVMWKELARRGEPAPPELGLPTNRLVVHRTSVSRAFRESFIPEDGGDAPSPNTIKSQWTRSTGRLRKFGVIGFSEPWFYWSGKPVLGIPGTQMQRSMFDDAPGIDEFPPDDVRG
jgi:AAA domain